MTLPVFTTPWVRRLLAVDRVEALRIAFNQNSTESLATIRPFLLLMALVIAATPAVIHLPSVVATLGVNTVTLTGGALCLAIVLRNVAGIPFRTVNNWRHALAITHTAFGLGCIPVALILLVSPDSVATLPTSTSSAEPMTPTLLTISRFIFFTAVWAAVTEEFIYRALLLSFLRRAPLRWTQRRKDVVAILVSALVFGLAHIPSWGPVLSLGVTGLGIGFGLAFVANGERLLPLVLYHFLFDVFSLSFALFLRPG